MTATRVVPPGGAVTVTPGHFGASEAFDLLVDTPELRVVVTRAVGSWSGPVTLPPSVVAGAHTLTAVGRHSGIAAQTTFPVRSDWPQQQFGAGHEGASPYEAIVGVGTARELRQRWEYADGNAAVTPGSPTVVGGIVYGVFGASVRW